MEVVCTLSFHYAFLNYTRPSDNPLNSNSHYIIDSCNFTNNAAKKIRKAVQLSSKNLFTYNEPTFGYGGGMSVFFRGNSTGNIIDIINTKFIGNAAVLGGGLFIEFSHYASRNTISIKDNSQFSSNWCSDNENPEDPEGGGVKILYNFYNGMILPRDNSVSFYQSSFLFNTAYWGGGVGYSLGKELYAHGTNLLYFFNCSWIGNSAKFGAAVDLYQPLSPGVAQAVVFENCSFISNSAFYHLQIDQFELRGAGIMYANSIVINFKGFVEFIKNVGTALVLFTSYVDVKDECHVMFTQNTGWRGGAVSLLASSWVEENTTVVFDRNNAEELGGAIYAELISEHKVVTQWNCFLQFNNPSVSPDDWNTKIKFQQNYAVFGGHSVYTTTLRSCVWNKDSAHVDADDIKKSCTGNHLNLMVNLGHTIFQENMKLLLLQIILQLTRVLLRSLLEKNVFCLLSILMMRVAMLVLFSLYNQIIKQQEVLMISLYMFMGTLCKFMERLILISTSL